MKRCLSILAVIMLLLGCSNVRTGSAPAEMTVDFTWDMEDECVDCSPAIYLGGVPRGTERFLVIMTNLSMNFHHGGGFVENDGSGVIPEGAVTRFQGPCPWSGCCSLYRISVQALDRNNRVIGVGKAMRRFPPGEESPVPVGPLFGYAGGAG